MDLSIVIPCFNEEDNIPLLIDKFNVYSSEYSFELILVDNGSNDNTWDLLNKLLPKHKFLKILKIENNIGYGDGILKGLAIGKGNYLGWTHADLQTDINDVFNALKLIKKMNFPENIYIKGKRKNRNIFDQFFTTGMSIIESLWLGVTLWDINGQPNVFPKNFFKLWEYPPKDFLLDLYSYSLAKKMGFSIKRIDVIFKKRKFGISSWNINLKSKFIFICNILIHSIPLRFKVTSKKLIKR